MARHKKTCKELNSIQNKLKISEKAIDDFVEKTKLINKLSEENIRLLKENSQFQESNKNLSAKHSKLIKENSKLHEDKQCETEKQ